MQGMCCFQLTKQLEIILTLFSPEIVVKYGLNHHYKYEEGEESETSGKKRPQQLKDAKLKELWHQASASGFSGELQTSCPCPH